MKGNKKVLAALLVVTLICTIVFFVARTNSQNRQIYPTLVERNLYVYCDYGSSNNHFNIKAKLSGDNQDKLVHNLVEDDESQPYEGNSAIFCKVEIENENWGGWLFTNGYIFSNSDEYQLNWGDYPNCGYDLTGAKELTFRAKGAKGGERVEFFLGGNGYDSNTGLKTGRYPDSTTKVSLGVVELENEYKEYTIPVDHVDLSYLTCGFGFVVSGNDNTEDVEFYVDEISYYFPDKVGAPAIAEHRMTIQEIIALIGAVTGALAIIIDIIKIKKIKDK